MNNRIDTFLAEVRNAPGFVTASATDSNWLEKLEAMERGLAALDRLADENPAILQVFDRIIRAIGRTDLSLKQRLLEVGKLFTEIRDGERIVN